MRVGAFSGAGFGPPPRAADLAVLRASGAELFLMLGGLGDSEASARAGLETLAGLNRPVVLLSGGRDTWAVSRAALADSSAGGRIMDATPLRRIRIGSTALIPVSGSDHGRYSVGEDGCGFSRRDLDAAAQELGPGTAERRWLLSWQAAAHSAHLPGAALNDTGLELGSYELARFGERIGAVGSLSAWPSGRQDVLVEGPLGARVVPRGYGPRLERSDGTRPAPGVLLLDLDDQGLRVVR